MTKAKYLEAGTGRRYNLVKRYNPQGRFTERQTGRRYDLVKIFTK